MKIISIRRNRNGNSRQTTNKMKQTQQILARQSPVNLQVLASLFILISTVVIVIECDRQNAGHRIAIDAGDSHGFKSSCGTADQVSQMIGKCLIPIQELIEGKVPVPKNDEDNIANCNRFNVSGTCVRQVAKDCLTGLHRTTTSAVASSIRRVRNSECKTVETRAKYTGPVGCAVKLKSELQGTLRNHTAITQAIRDLSNVSGEEKMVKVCCLMDSMDKMIEQVMKRECPSAVPILLNILHALTDDAKATLCRNPKCAHALNGLIPARLKTKQEFIEPIVQILFQINVD